MLESLLFFFLICFDTEWQASCCAGATDYRVVPELLKIVKLDTDGEATVLWRSFRLPYCVKILIFINLDSFEMLLFFVLYF